MEVFKLSLVFLFFLLLIIAVGLGYVSLRKDPIRSIAASSSLFLLLISCVELAVDGNRAMRVVLVALVAIGFLFLML